MIDPDADEGWLRELREDGADMAHDLIEPDSQFDHLHRREDIFHVVSAIEDFEGFGLGVRKTLATYGAVSFSCLWPQYEILKHDPLIERCPIFRTFHENEPDKPYRLVFAISDIGSVYPLKAMILHMALERGFSGFQSVDVISPTYHIHARVELNRHLPASIANRMSFRVPAIDRSILQNGYTAALGGLTPSQLAGFPNMWERESYTPQEIDERMRAFPKRPRPGPGLDGPGRQHIL